MRTRDYHTILDDKGIHNQTEFHQQAFARNIGILTKEEQVRLQKATIAIPGMGGVGGHHLITMVRTGVARFHLADFDVFDPVNVNRQYGARVTSFNESKIKVMIDEALSINPFLDIKSFDQGVTSDNVDAFLKGVDVVLDGVDFFEFDIRRIIFNKARELGIHVVTAAPLGFSCAMLIFSPDKGPGFDEFFDIYDEMPENDKYLNFALGLAPRATHISYMDRTKIDLDKKVGPSNIIACQTCAAMAATEALRIILKRKGLKPVPCYCQFDQYAGKYRKGILRMGNRNPIQQAKKYYVKNFLLKIRTRIGPERPEFPEVILRDGQISNYAMEYLLKAGIQAPSGDNAQPWKFSIQQNKIYIYLDDQADLSFFNVRQTASIISCGAVIENIKIAANTLGLKSEISYYPDSDNEKLVAAIDFEKAEQAADPLHEFIWSRHTNRKLYSKKAVPLSILNSVQTEVVKIPGARIHFLTDRNLLKKLAKLIFSVDRIRTEFKPLHEHFTRMTRFKEKDIFQKRDGLPIKNLEAGLAGELFLKVTKPWSVMKIVNALGISRLVAFHSYKGIMASAGTALITLQDSKLEDFIEGGRAMERAWLSLSSHGIKVQPMTAVTLFWMRWHMGMEDSFDKHHQEILKRTWNIYQELFPDVDFSRNSHIMLFRFGYGSEINCKTMRKKLDSFYI